MTGAELAERLQSDVLKQSDLFAQHWPGFEDPTNVEPPHRQRTAVNRLLGYAQFLGLMGPDGRPPDGPLRDLKRWQKRIGVLRDVDVVRDVMEELRADAGEAATPAADAMAEELSGTRARMAERLLADVIGWPGAQARVAAADVREMLLGHARLLTELRDHAGFRRRAIASVDVPWKAALEGLALDHADVPLHAFRVRNKRLRAVFETLGEEGRLKHIQRAHEVLGALSDLAVIRERLRVMRARWALDRRDLDGAAGALEAARTRAETAQFDRWFAVWPKLVG